MSQKSRERQKLRRLSEKQKTAAAVPLTEETLKVIAAITNKIQRTAVEGVIKEFPGGTLALLGHDYSWSTHVDGKATRILVGPDGLCEPQIDVDLVPRR